MPAHGVLSNCQLPHPISRHTIDSRLVSYSRQTVSHGFTVLVAQFGQVAAWGSLRPSRDSNANGITDAGDLITLAAARVINLGIGYLDNGTCMVADVRESWHRQVARVRSCCVFNSNLRHNLLSYKHECQLDCSLNRNQKGRCTVNQKKWVWHILPRSKMLQTPHHKSEKIYDYQSIKT